MVFAKNLLLTFALALMGSAMTLPLEPRADGGLKLDFRVRKLDGDSSNESKRSSLSGTLTNKGIFYEVPLLFGSNSQEVYLDIDSGSSDTWVMDSNVNCLLPVGGCSDNGVYNPTTSTTSNETTEEMFIMYGDFSGSYGYFYHDDVKFGDQTIKQFKFGVANSSSVTHGGILGLGFTALESNTVQKNLPEYDNFPLALKNQGLISGNYYSVFLDGPTAKTGSIIFGGTDESKYSGPVQVAPFTSDRITQVKLDHIKGNNGSIQTNFDVVLDTGTEFTLLPQDLIDKIAAEYPGATKKDGQWKVDPTKIPSGSLEFSFDGTNTILVPYADFIDSTNELNIYAVNSPGYQGILGDTFLRRAYVTFDLDKKQASIAQAKTT